MQSCAFMSYLAKIVILFSGIVVLPLEATRQFACRAPGLNYFISWAVDQMPATNLEYAKESDYIEENGTVNRYLTFTANTSTNNSHLFCRVSQIQSGMSLEEFEVNLTVLLQGKYTKFD